MSSIRIKRALFFLFLSQFSLSAIHAIMKMRSEKFTPILSQKGGVYHEKDSFRIFRRFLLASLCALPAFAVSQARSVNATTTAETVSLICEYCGQSDMICVDEYYASWYTINFIPCQGRDPRYNDSVENRTHIEIYQCQSCKFGTSVVSTEEQISHKHPAMRAYDLPRF